MSSGAAARKVEVRMAVIGGGAGAREFVIRWLEMGGFRVPAAVSVFEPRAALGRGLAWSAERTPVLANMRIDTLGPTYAAYDLIRSILQDLGHPEAVEEYPRRDAVGLALDERWRREAENLPEGFRLEHIAKEAVDLRWDGHAATVVTADGATYGGYDVVVLALGNLSARRPESLAGFAGFIDGWDVAAIQKVPANSDVLIKGAGLTAIDATLRLLDGGHKRGDGSIAWQSRSGTLPFIRPGQMKLDPQFLSCALLGPLMRGAEESGSLTVRELWRLFELELRAQARVVKGRFSPGTDFDGFVEMVELHRDASRGRTFLDQGIRGADEVSLWFSVAKLFDEYLIPILWNALPAGEKAVFLGEWRREFDRYFEPIPVNNGRRVKEWIDDGTIQLLRTQTEHQADPVSGKVVFDPGWDDPLGERSAAELQGRYAKGFDYLIDATGISSDLGTANSELVMNLVRSKVLSPNALEGEDGQSRPSLGARIDWPTGAVLGPEGKPHGWLYTLAGSLSTGAHWYTNSFMAVSVSGQRVAGDLIRRCAGC